MQTSMAIYPENVRNAVALAERIFEVNDWRYNGTKPLPTDMADIIMQMIDLTKDVLDRNGGYNVKDTANSSCGRFNVTTKRYYNPDGTWATESVNIALSLGTVFTPGPDATETDL